MYYNKRPSNNQKGDIIRCVENDFQEARKRMVFSFFVSCFVLNIVKTGDEYKDIERDWRGGQEIKEETEIIF